MYLIYVDESGDSGQSPKGTPFFVISGLIVHENDWNKTFQDFIDLRKKLKQKYRIPQRIAFHAYDLVNGHRQYHHSQSGLKTKDRFDIYRDILTELSKFSQIRVLNVFIRKDRQPLTQDVFEWGWQMFIQRFNNFLEKQSKDKGIDEYGLLFTDRTQDKKLRQLLRRMRAFNFVPSKYSASPARKILVQNILDDPIPRESPESYFVQMSDLIAYSLARRDYVRSDIKKYGFETYFDKLTPICLCDASKYDPQGIVYWPR